MFFKVASCPVGDLEELCENLIHETEYDDDTARTQRRTL